VVRPAASSARQITSVGYSVGVHVNHDSGAGDQIAAIDVGTHRHVPRPVTIRGLSKTGTELSASLACHLHSVRLATSREQAPSYCRNRGYWRADSTRQPQRRRGEQKAASMMRFQPCIQFVEIPQFAEMDAELEQAMTVQWDEGSRPGRAAWRDRFHRIVVGCNRRDATVGDPLQQAFVSPVQRRAGIAQNLGFGSASHFQQHGRKAGMKAQDVAGLESDVICLHDPHQVIISDKPPRATEVSLEINHHSAPLHSRRSHVLDTDRHRSVVAAFGGSTNLFSCSISIVVDQFGHTVAVGIK
jgi:hypothetical protein